MTRPWPNAMSGQTAERSSFLEVSPKEMAFACYNAAMVTFGGALIQIGFASINIGRSITLLAPEATMVGNVFGVMSVVAMIAGLWLSISNWDNPHRKTVYDEFFSVERPLALKVIVGAFGIVSFGAIFVCLLGSAWLQAEFNIPIGVSKLIVGIGLLSVALLTAAQADNFASMYSRYRTQIM